VVGAVPASLPTPSLPDIAPEKWAKLVPLALLIAIVVMVQTAATTRSFLSDPDKPADVDRDFLGVGAGSILAGLFGAFPVDASSARTGIVFGNRRTVATLGLFAAAIVLGAARIRRPRCCATFLTPRSAACCCSWHAHHPRQADRHDLSAVAG